MLDGKAFATVATAFSSFAAIMDHAIDFEDNPAVTTVHMLYSDTVNQQLYTKLEKE